MAEELISCWNSPRNLFCSSPCSLGWPSYEMIMDMKSSTLGSTDSDGSSAVLGVAQPPINSIMGISAADWNHDLLRDTGKSEENINYSNFLLDSTSSMLINSQDSAGVDQDQQQPLNSISTSSECVATSYSYASSVLQTLFDTDSQPQQSLVDMNTYSLNSNGFLPSASPISNNRSIWNSTAAALTDAPSTFLPSPHESHFISSSLTNHINKPPHHIHTTAAKQPHEQGKDLTTVVKKSSHEPAFKRPRIETPSALPTFKVRKEKLGDRITALQQLVSPFGKTDTASVLHEAIDYIKFLHDQVNALSTPYLKYGSPPTQRQQDDKAKDEQGPTKELKTRGLCLVPISSTFPVAAETTTDFWTPTFAGSFR